MTQRPSLFERAAEIYDFESGLPVARAADLPPPRPRAFRVAVAPQPEPEPIVVAQAQAQPSVQPQAPVQADVQARPEPGVARRSAPQMAPVHHRRVEVDADAMAATGLLSPDAPAGGLAEEMRLIKRRLLAAVDAADARGDDSARVVLVASGQPGEGKTFMALNLALSIASEQERSVLLIDGDNAKPELLARLGIEDEGAGFVDSLADPRLDPESLVLDTDVPHLGLLPAGRRERNIPEYFASARMPELLGRLQAADPTRIVIIDSSPVLAASAAGVLAQHAGQTLVVVKADKTAEADLKETLDLLSACDHLSLVLNTTAFQVGGRRYGKYEEYR